MAAEDVILPADLLQQFMEDVFIAAGVPERDARLSAQVLIAADLRGVESHGIGRLRMYIERLKSGQHKAETNIEIVRQTATTAVIDGHQGMGMVVASRAMQMAIDKAAQYGMGSTAVRNSTHFGIAGYYVQMAVEQGLIGMAFTNARPAIAPTFGVQPMLGTNPIAFGAPSDEDFPFLFDGATSIIQRGKIEVLARKQQPASAGWVTNTRGEPETDAPGILNGLTAGEAALLPLGGAGELFAGYKGYGLATMVEILSASLQQGAFLYGLTGLGEANEPQPFNLGHFFIAVQVESFTDLESFKRTTGQILRELRGSRKAPGQGRIYTAGEKEYLNEQRIRKEGVPVNASLQSYMRWLRDSLQLSQYRFPFE